jgi:mannose-6-phosphate isomerase-like protein (cupin superfamily)
MRRSTMADTGPPQRQENRTSSILTRDELEAALRTPGPAIDTILRTVDAGRHDIAIAVVRMEQATEGFYAHSAITEVYHILSGHGTHSCGGKLVNPTRADFDVTGPGFRANAVEGAEAVKVGPGDVVVIPPGTPHAWTDLPEPIVYLMTRVDPDRVLRRRWTATAQG